MNSFDSLPLTRGRIEWAISQTRSMTQASKMIGCCFTTFKKYALQYDLWKPNQSGRGIPKRRRLKMKIDSPVDFDKERWEEVLKVMNGLGSV